MTGVKKNNPKCHCNLGHFYINRQNNEYDEEKALQCYKLAAKLGNAEAENSLGLYYLFGQNGAAVSHEKAIYHFTRCISLEAADMAQILFELLFKERFSGHAYFNLAQCYIQLNAGGDKNIDLIQQHLKLAAAQGHVAAIEYLQSFDNQVDYDGALMQGYS